jgi:carbon-monoxide dehydrogenase small subunit/xanthine dehydrogenase small subunit
MILAALALPKRATREQMRVGLAGNLCRCTGYEAIYRAIQRAASEGAETEAAGDGR